MSSQQPANGLFFQRARVEQPWVEAVEAAEAPEVSIFSVSRYSTWYKLSYT